MTRVLWEGAVAVWVVVACVGAGSIASAATKATSLGRFFTKTGRKELHNRSVMLEISKPTQGELKVRVALKLPDTPSTTNRVADSAVTLKLPRKDAVWFVYTEDGKRFWLYDGREAGLLHVALAPKAVHDKTSGYTVNERYKAADARMLRSAPKAVRERLPKALLVSANPG